jgi:hypothetical protein
MFYGKISRHEMNTLSNFSLNNILFYPQETSFDES